MENLVEFASENGFAIDPSTSGTLNDSLQAIKRADERSFEVLQIQATKPMQLALYFATGEHGESQWRHYALNFERYTHFTSPIRRCVCHPSSATEYSCWFVIIVASADTPTYRCIAS